MLLHTPQAMRRAKSDALALLEVATNLATCGNFNAQLLLLGSPMIGSYISWNDASFSS